MSRRVRADQLRSSPLAQRLVRRLRQAGIKLPQADSNYALRGEAPGHWQRSAGAWAWELYVRHGQDWRPTSIGSSDRASSLRKNSIIGYHFAHGDCHVSIENSPNKPEKGGRRCLNG